PPACFAVAEGVADLPDGSAASGQQALHVVFGGGLQIAVTRHRDALNMQVGHTVAGQLRGVHFQHAASVEKSPDLPVKRGPCREGTGRCAGAPVGHQALTRLTYSPVRVSTLTISPVCTNSGTRTVAPVDSRAGLPPVPAVSPLTPGSVSTISSSTKFGGATASGAPFHRVTVQTSSSFSH